MEYLVVKWVHILSSTVLFGTGVGSAFYLLTAAVTRDVHVVAHMSRWVVRADWLFTAATAVIQPLTGWWLMRLAGIPASSLWLSWSIGLFVMAMACWLPVVWLQVRMRDVADQAHQSSSPLPPTFWLYFRWWFALGVPALVAFLLIFWLMISKPL